MRLIFIILFLVCSQFFFDVSYSQDNQNHCSELYGCQNEETQIKFFPTLSKKEIQIRNSEVYKRDSDHCDSYAQNLKKRNPKINSYEERCKEYLILLGIREKNSHADIDPVDKDIDFVDKNEWDSPQEILEVCKSSKKFRNLDVSFEIISECEYSIKRTAGIKSYQISREDLEGIYNLPDQYRNLKSEIEQAAGFEYSNEIDVLQNTNKELSSKTDDEKLKLISQRKNEDTRGKWGVNFSMTKQDIGCTSVWVCTFNGVIVKFENVGDLYFVERFGKMLGEYSVPKYNKVRNNLLSKYKSVVEPSSSDWDIWSKRGRSDFVYYLDHVFENKKNPEEPKYIILRVESTNIADFIKVWYVKESYGKKLVKEKIMKENYMDDL